MLIPSSQKHQQGVLILEVLIAILIFAIGILAVVGLQGQAIKHVTEARARTEATTIADSIIGQLWMDIANISSKAGTYSDNSSEIGKIATQLPNGKAVIVVNGSLATVTLTWRVQGASSDNKLVMQASINPALAP